MSGNGKTAVLDQPEAAVIHSLDLNEQGPFALAAQPPYRMKFVIEGTAPILFHRYDCESVREKGEAAKGSAAKKTDDVESYYYRNAKGQVCITAEGVHAALISAGRWDKDPRSPRKSAMDLVKAGIIVEPNLIPCSRKGKAIKTADYLDTRRVVVNHSAVPRVRPALQPGWQAEFEALVLASDLLTTQAVRVLMQRAGQYCGLFEMRPQYGRFQVVSAEVVKV